MSPSQGLMLSRTNAATSTVGAFFLAAAPLGGCDEAAGCGSAELAKPLLLVGGQGGGGEEG